MEGPGNKRTGFWLRRTHWRQPGLGRQQHLNGDAASWGGIWCNNFADCSCRLGGGEVLPQATGRQSKTNLNTDSFETPLKLTALMADYDRPWYVVGGWAIDLFLGR